MKKEEEEHVQTAVRVPKSWISRLDKIAEKLSSPGARVTRADALRMATHFGMNELETKQQDKKKR